MPKEIPTRPRMQHAATTQPATLSEIRTPHLTNKSVSRSGAKKPPSPRAETTMT